MLLRMIRMIIIIGFRLEKLYRLSEDSSSCLKINLGLKAELPMQTQKF